MDSSHPTSRIESLLLEQELIRPEDLERAQAIQNAHQKLKEQPMGMILVTRKLISRQDLGLLLADPDTQADIRRILGEGTHRDLPRHLSLRSLVNEGHVTADVMQHAVQKAMNTQDFLKRALRKQRIRGSDLETVLRIKRYNPSVSEVLFEENLVSLTELNRVCREGDDNPSLGRILIMQGLAYASDIDSALSEQKGSHAPLGRILIERGRLTLTQLYFALSIQFNTPFRDLKGYEFNGRQQSLLRDIVGQSYAREHEILPIFLNENNLTLAVSSPARLVNMHELMARYSHLTMNCVLITEEKFDQLYAMLYGEILKRSGHNDAERPSAASADGGSWVITDPRAQSFLLAHLYDRYCALRADAGRSPIDNGRELFFRFIEEQFDRISAAYQCRAVTVWFDDSRGDPIIKASPVVQSAVRNPSSETGEPCHESSPSPAAKAEWEKPMCR
ncbi:hypothetical protein JCM14469_12490 [Desulfatiferula olefinivorans]